jgi:hypothetical protein
MPALEHLSFDFAAPAAGKEPVTVAIESNPEVTLVEVTFTENLNIVIHGATVMRTGGMWNNVSPDRVQNFAVGRTSTAFEQIDSVFTLVLCHKSVRPTGQFNRCGRHL